MTPDQLFALTSERAEMLRRSINAADPDAARRCFIFHQRYQMDAAETWQLSSVLVGELVQYVCETGSDGQVVAEAPIVSSFVATYLREGRSDSFFQSVGEQLDILQVQSRYSVVDHLIRSSIEAAQRQEAGEQDFVPEQREPPARPASRPGRPESQSVRWRDRQETEHTLLDDDDDVRNDIDEAELRLDEDGTEYRWDDPNQCWLRPDGTEWIIVHGTFMARAFGESLLNEYRARQSDLGAMSMKQLDKELNRMTRRSRWRR